MRELDMMSKIDGRGNSHFALMRPLKFNTYFYLYSNKNMLNAIFVDKDGKVLYEKKN